MLWFKNLKTAAKLILAFSLVSLLTAGLGLFALRSLGKVTDISSRMYATDVQGLLHLKESNIQLLRISRAVRNAILDEDRTAIEGRRQDIVRYDAAYRQEFQAYQGLIVSAEAKAIAEDVFQRYNLLRPKQDAIVDLARENRDVQAKAGLAEIRAMADTIDVLLDKLEVSKRARLEVAVAETATTEKAARIGVLATLIATIVLSLLIGLTIARMIARPLAQSVEVLQGVAAGDFTRRLAVSTTDEVGQMAAALNQAVGGMQVALTEVRSSADEVASASQQLSAAAEEISSGAQEQASGLEETASSLEEITSTVRQNADNAQQASQLAGGARDVAEKGGRVVSEAVVAMGEINDSSKQIADIITTIDEIAFQTNLLALNAAVEAARAGEQGRGFAVVATEVRNLAQRSATAAKEIKGLIQDSVRKVENGSALVNQSGQTLQDIVISVKRVTDIVAEIAAATREQATGIDQVNRAVTQMDSVTQSNASQTEELSGTAESLSAQAEQLQSLVARFRLEEHPVAVVHAPAAKPRARKAPVAAPRRTAVPAAARPEPLRDLDEAVPAGAAEGTFEEF